MISRRSALGGGALVLAGPFIHPGRFRLFANTGREYSARTIELVRKPSADAGVISNARLGGLHHRIGWREAA